MGMHHGIIGAACAWAKLEPNLAWFVGDFVDRRAIQTIEQVDLNEGDTLIGGEYQGASFLLDTLMILSCDYDRVAELSSRIAASVVAVCGETVSGTFSMCVAEG